MYFINSLRHLHICVAYHSEDICIMYFCFCKYFCTSVFACVNVEVNNRLGVSETTPSSCKLCM